MTAGTARTAGDGRAPGDAGRGRRRPGAGLGLATAPNLRDVGGWPTRDGGRVATGALYRSTDLSRLAGPDVPAFAELGIRSVYDLRTAGERAARPGPAARGDRLPRPRRPGRLDDGRAGEPHDAPGRSAGGHAPRWPGAR